MGQQALDRADVRPTVAQGLDREGVAGRRGRRRWARRRCARRQHDEDEDGWHQATDDGRHPDSLPKRTRHGGRHASTSRSCRPGGYPAAVERSTDAVELLDGPLDDPAALRTTSATCVGSTAGSAASSLTVPAIEALAAHRPSSPSSTWGPAGPTSRSRCWSERAPAAGGWSVVASTAGPRSSRRRRSARARVPATTGPDAPRRRRPLAPLPRPLVRHRPRLARAPSPEPRRGARLPRGDGTRREDRRRRQRPVARPARLARRLADGPPADRQPIHPPRRAALGPACVPGVEWPPAARRRADPGRDAAARGPPLRDRARSTRPPSTGSTTRTRRRPDRAGE